MLAAAAFTSFGLGRRALASSALARDFLPFPARLREADSDCLFAACDLLPLPLLSFPRLRFRITRSTSFEALREYFRAMIHPFLVRAGLEISPLRVGS